MDGHAGVRPGHSSPRLSTPTRWPLTVTRLDGRFYVKILEVEGAPLRPGDELLSINDVSLRDRFETAFVRSTGSTPAGREYRALDTMRDGADERLRIQAARPGGSNFICELPSLRGSDAPEEPIRWKKIEGGRSFVRFICRCHN